MNETTRKGWRELYGRGWSLLPSDPQTKRTLTTWKEYQRARAGVETVKGWLAQWPHANPGVITGRVSNVIVLDCDGTEGMRSILAAGTIPHTPTVKTARGAHYYFVYPDLEAGQRVITKAGILPGLDIRGDGGYVVGVGAVHSSGAIYTWQLSPDEVNFAQAPQWLLDLVVSSEPDPFDAKPLYVPPPVMAQGDDRARKYALAALEGEAWKVRNAEDGTKHSRLLYSAIATAGFIPHISESEIEIALYNAVADRASDKRAARITIRDGIDYGSRRPREIPEGRVEYRIYEPVLEWHEVPADPDIDEGEPVQEPEPHRWTPVAIGDLVVTQEHVPWVWHGYIARQMQTLFTGLWKSGKSTLLSHLLKALEGGDQEFAGQRVTKARALVVSEESPRHWVTRRQDLQIGNHIHLICRPFLGNCSDSEWGSLIRHCADLVATNDYGLVIFDSLPNLWSVQKENDNAEVKRAITPMNLITEAGAAVLMSAHPSKADGPVGTATRGASQIQTMVDVIIEMRRLQPDDIEDTHRVLSGLGRFEETLPELVIDYAAGLGYTAQGTKQQAKRDIRHQTIINILPTERPGYTIDELLEEWPDREQKPTRHTLASDLHYMGATLATVLREGKGTKADPQRFWYSAQNEQYQRAG